MKTFARRSAQTGFSLIELLISVTIGLLILIAIGTVYINSNNLTRQREDQAQLNDPARNVMLLLRYNLNQAGYVDIFDLDATNRAQAASLFVPGDDVLTNAFLRDPGAATVSAPLNRFFPGLTPVFGCDGAMNDTPNNIVTVGPRFPPQAPLVQSCGAASATRHTLQIAYQGVANAAANANRSLNAANTNTGEGLDCLQQAPPGASVFVVNRFSAPAPAVVGGVSQFRCAGSGTNQTQDIAAGVEEFILRYQMAAPGSAAARQAAGGAQQRYINATQVSASPQGWAGVTAVEICIVSATDPARGPAALGTVALQPVRPTCQRDAQGNFLPDIARVAGDVRLWKRFTSVVSVRNAVFATPL